MGDPGAMEKLLSQGMFEPKATPEQAAALERLETLLALIEGWVQTVVTAALAVLLWWLSRDVVSVLPPVVDPPVEGPIERVRTDTRLLFAATVLAGLTLVLTTLAILRRSPRRGA